MYFYVKLLIIVSIYGYTNSNSIGRSDDSHWSYDGENGPENWPGICHIGTRQSPIDIGIAKEQLFGIPLKLIGGFWENVSWNGAWNGHTYVAKMENTENSAFLFGGQLGSTYVFHSLHLHWGSEHTIHGERFTGEMHLVHYNLKYSYEDALTKSDGLAVLGILLQESDDNVNEKFSNFIDALTSVSDEESIGEFKFASLLHTSLEPWVRYDGSLTTPGCTENVKWTVMLEPIVIHKGLIPIYQKTYSNSFRPTQNLNNRTVYIQREVSGSARSNFNLLIILSLATLNISQVVK